MSRLWLIALLIVQLSLTGGFASANPLDMARSQPAPPTKGEQACVERVNSPVCQKFQGESGLLTADQCKAHANLENVSILNEFTNCVLGAAFSVWDLLKFLWEAVKFIATAPFKTVGGIYNYLTDGDTRASSHAGLQSAMESAGDYLQSIYPYLVTEFQKSYDSVGPPWNVTEATTALAAANNLRSRLVAGLLSSAWNIVKAKVEEISCFDSGTQMQMACRLAGDIFLPPAAFFGLLKHGVKGLKEMPGLMEKLKGTFKISEGGAVGKVSEDLGGILPKQRSQAPVSGKDLSPAPNAKPTVPSGDSGVVAAAKARGIDVGTEARFPRTGGDVGSASLSKSRRAFGEVVPPKKSPKAHQTPYISFMDGEKRRPGMIIGETEDRYRVLVPEGAEALREQSLRKSSDLAIRDSDLSVVVFERTGELRVDDFREGVRTGRFKKTDEFVSFVDDQSRDRIPARVFGVNSAGRVEVDVVTRSGLVRRELTNSELASGRLSSTAKENFANFSKGLPSPSEVAGNRWRPDKYMNGSEGTRRALALLEENKLIPKHEVIDRGVKYKLTDVFKDKSGYPMVVAEVTVGGKTYLRAYYRSGSANEFRNMLELQRTETGKIWFNKGLSEAAQGPPAAVQVEMQKLMFEREQVPVVAFERLDGIFPVTRVKVLGAETTEARRFAKEISSVEILSPPPPYRSLDTPSGKATRMPGNVVVAEAKNRPLFKKPSSEYLVQTEKGPATARVFGSQDGSLEYIFLTDLEGKTWISSVKSVSDINSYGVPKHFVKDSGDLTTPRWEYASQIPKEYGGSSRSGRADAWRYIREIPEIQRFYREYLKKPIPL